MEQIHVLIVDDRAPVRKSIQMFLRTEQSIRVVGQAGTVHDAICQAEKLKPNVILMDLMMHQRESYETITRIKLALPDVGIIVLSMSEDETRIMAALEAGADVYIRKNIDGEALLRSIKLVWQQRTTKRLGGARNRALSNLNNLNEQDQSE